ncbi:Hemoglobin subunit beta-2 [Oryzias melastigma]|uniref:Hemoglobin subunit beta-2 n=1 Tax=Oryzias melastigma TaxID=30732 RepID=A0A834FAS5_ORYME|nr:Hemoglobin subunit beta-2 [Oryzias melastigma]
MVKWSDFERATIQDIFSKIDKDVVGPAALSRYFGSFGNLYNAAAISSNPKVAAHGKVVIGGLEKALQNMDNIKPAYADLSVLHSEKLQVDPDNFKLLADCLTIVVASNLGKSFTPDVHAAFQKFLDVVVAALRKQYH